jgi:hypothetical protein
MITLFKITQSFLISLPGLFEYDLEICQYKPIDTTLTWIIEFIKN